MSILSSISQKFSQYFGDQSSQESPEDPSQNQKSSFNETLRQAGQQLRELVYQGNNDRHWNTAITGKIGGPCDIAQADNFQSTEPLANEVLTGVNTLSGVAAFAVNTVSNTVCGIAFDLPNAVEEKIVGMGGPSFDELFVSAQMTPGPPVDDALVYGLNRLTEIGGKLRSMASSRSTSILGQDFPQLILEPAIGLKSDQGFSRRSSAFLQEFPSLEMHESAGGHLIKKHVGKTEVELRTRLEREPKIKVASSFLDEEIAQYSTNRVMTNFQDKIQSWLQGKSRQLELEDTMPSSIGIGVVQNSKEVLELSKVKVLLRRDIHFPLGYKIHTGYPIP